jgi:hypothetical protein
MGRHSRIVSVVAVVLVAAGAAAAQSMLAGPSPGLSVSGGSVVAQSSTPSTSTPSATTPSTALTGDASATPTSPAAAAETPAPAGTGTTAVTGAAAIERIVSFTQTVESGTTAVTVFTVPAGRQLVVTDVVITNTGGAPVCGASVAPGAATTPSATAAGESGTGVLCVPAQTSLNLGLTTGMEFTAGQSLVLANGGGTAGRTLSFHLRGFLAIPGA